MKPPIFFAVTRLLLAIILIVVSLPITGAADAEVTLQWDGKHPEPDGYILYYRTADQEYDDSRSFDVGPEISEIIDGLEENTTYYFVVRAYIESDLGGGSRKLSGNSNEVAFNSGGQMNVSVPVDSNLAGDDYSSGQVNDSVPVDNNLAGDDYGSGQVNDSVPVDSNLAGDDSGGDSNGTFNDFVTGCLIQTLNNR